MAAIAGEIGVLAYEMAGELLGEFGLQSEKNVYAGRIGVLIRNQLIRGIPLASAIARVFHSESGGRQVPDHLFQRASNSRYTIGSIELENAVGDYLRLRGLNIDLAPEVRQLIMDSQNIEPGLIDAGLRRNRQREQDAADAADIAERNRQQAINIENIPVGGESTEHKINIGENEPLVDVPLDDPSDETKSNLPRHIAIGTGIVAGAGGIASVIGTNLPTVEHMPRPIHQTQPTQPTQPITVEHLPRPIHSTHPVKPIQPKNNPISNPIGNPIGNPTLPIKKPINPIGNPFLGTDDFATIPKNKQKVMTGHWIPPKHGTYNLNKWAEYTRGKSLYLLNH